MINTATNEEKITALDFIQSSMVDNSVLDSANHTTSDFTLQTSSNSWNLFPELFIEDLSILADKKYADSSNNIFWCQQFLVKSITVIKPPTVPV